MQHYQEYDLRYLETKLHLSLPLIFFLLYF